MPRTFVSLALLLLLGPTVVAAGWEEGVAAFKSGNFDHAVKEFRAEVRAQPQQHHGHYLLGLTLHKLERKEEALNHLRKAYDLNPNQVSYQLALASAYLDAKQTTKAGRLLPAIDRDALAPVQRALYDGVLAATGRRARRTNLKVERERFAEAEVRRIEQELRELPRRAPPRR